MVSLVLLFVSLAHAGSVEQDIVNVFNKTESVQKKFLQDTMKNHDQAESFNQNEFQPAVDKMILLMKSKSCKPCLSKYIKSLKLLNNSANKMLTLQLKQIVSEHPNLLSETCSKSSKQVKERLRLRLETAIHHLAEERHVDQTVIQKTIAKCMVATSTIPKSY